MGYYAGFDGNLKVKEGKIEELRGILKNDSNSGSKTSIVTDGAQVVVEDDGYMYFYERYNKYDNDYWYAFYDMVAPYIEYGELEWNGEGNEQWSVVFKDGKWKELPGFVIYGNDIIHAFIREIGNKMPENVKKVLKSWKLSEEL